MSSDLSAVENALKAPFREDDIEWRVQRSGVKKNGQPWALCVPYVTSRGVQDRLDEAVGVGRWQDKYLASPSGNGMLCELSLRLPLDGGEQWVSKIDGADADERENGNTNAVKGLISNAFKRAAVKWGIGRYLYRLDACWAQFHENGKESINIDGKFFKYDVPRIERAAFLKESALSSSPAKNFNVSALAARKEEDEEDRPSRPIFRGFRDEAKEEVAF